MSEKYLNLCRACGEDFAGVAIFDAHRVGKHAHTYAEGLAGTPAVEDGRRCLDGDEMQANGWDRKERGRWHDPEKTEKTRATFAKVPA